MPVVALVVCDAERGPVDRIYLCEDGRAQERDLVVELLGEMGEGEVWIADRNFVTAEIYHADQADPHTLEDCVQQAQTNVRECGAEKQLVAVVADKGYHSAAGLAALREHTPYRGYIAELAAPHGRR